MRIGIFGGSFNPPHKMHKNIAIFLLQNNYIDKVIYVPTGNKYNKEDLIEAKYRLKMLEIMTRNDNRMNTSNYEIKNTLTYTYQTLDYFKSIYPNDEIYFICGSDNLKEITTWKNYKYILNNYKLLVIKRNNDNLDEIIKNLDNKGIVIIKINSEDTSSSTIRKDLKSGKDNSNIDEDILKYIKKEKLYISDKEK